MKEVLRYTMFDVLRSKWALAYALFFMLSSCTLLLLSRDMSSSIISMMSITLVLVPLMTIIFSVIYFYNARDYIDLLLAQPISRNALFLGLYFGITHALAICLIIGLLLPFLAFNLVGSALVGSVLSLLAVNVLLTYIFSAIGFYLALRNENRVKGFGFAIFSWLFFAVIYDGLFIFLLSVFREYPLENTALAGSFLNPINLSRILMLMQLDISALLGLTGTVFIRFFGDTTGILTAFILLAIWLVVPIFSIVRLSSRRDF